MMGYLYLFKSYTFWTWCTTKSCPAIGWRRIVIHSTPTRLLDTHSPLPVYFISRKIPAYPFIRAYPVIKFQEKFPPTRLFEPPLVLET